VYDTGRCRPGLVFRMRYVPPTVLLIDDDAAFVTLLQRELGAAGYRTEVAPTDGGPFAVHTFVRARTPDAVVLDVAMGAEHRGWSILRGLVFDPDTAGIPVLVCTAAARAVELHEPALARAGVRTLPKPFRREQLLDALAEATAPSPEQRSDDGLWGNLTRRHREVAALVARGLTNRGIAAELVLTEGTAANHVRGLMLRLGVNSRAQVAAWVVSDPRRRAAIKWARGAAPIATSAVRDRADGAAHAGSGAGWSSAAYASRHAR
jgi:DNA-binding NarL/FixJ family response regulator